VVAGFSDKSRVNENSAIRKVVAGFSGKSRVNENSAIRKVSPGFRTNRAGTKKTQPAILIRSRVIRASVLLKLHPGPAISVDGFVIAP